MICDYSCGNWMLKVATDKVLLCQIKCIVKFNSQSNTISDFIMDFITFFTISARFCKNLFLNNFIRCATDKKIIVVLYIYFQYIIVNIIHVSVLQIKCSPINLIFFTTTFLHPITKRHDTIIIYFYNNVTSAIARRRRKCAEKEKEK